MYICVMSHFSIQQRLGQHCKSTIFNKTAARILQWAYMYLSFIYLSLSYQDFVTFALFSASFSP